MSANSANVLLADDDVALTEMLGDYLRAEGFSVDAVHNGQDAVAASISGSYSVVVLDIMMPRLSGSEALRVIRRHSDVPVIMLTAKGNSADRVSGLERGADDYVPKPYDPAELVARLRAVLRRHTRQKASGASPWKFVLSGVVVDEDDHRAEVNGEALDLTTSEFTLLAALLATPERVVSKDELSLKVLGRPRQPYDRSIDVHVSNLRHKLAAHAAGITVETVRSIGYRAVAGEAQGQ